MTVRSFCVNPFQVNCLVCHDGDEAVLIDPGTYVPAERDSVLAYMERTGLVLRQILLTHGHIDHVLDLAHFAGASGLSYLMHRADLPLVGDAPYRATTYGLEMIEPPAPGGFLAEGDVVVVGTARWEVLHTPGHSPGSISFLDRENGLVIVGDVLFQNSIGRTDLWQGSLPQLMESIHQKLMTLPDETIVYPGHGPATTIGAERTSNPFLR